jgi:hypothetical protein
MQLDTRCFNQIITTLLIHVIDIVKAGSTINIAHSINDTEEINMVRLTVCITSTNMDVNRKVCGSIYCLIFGSAGNDKKIRKREKLNRDETINRGCGSVFSLTASCNDTVENGVVSRRL